MKAIIRIVCIAAVSLCIALPATAQNFKKKQASQERTIKAAKRAGRITDREYDKLMHEQYVIIETIDKANEDGYLTAHEKNRIHDKLGRAEKRLRRYKHNGEVY